MQQDNANRRIPVYISTPLGIEPGSLMMGNKRVDHWTSGTVYECQRWAPAIFSVVHFCWSAIQKQCFRFSLVRNFKKFGSPLALVRYSAIAIFSVVFALVHNSGIPLPLFSLQSTATSPQFRYSDTAIFTVVHSVPQLAIPQFAILQFAILQFAIPQFAFPQFAFPQFALPQYQYQYWYQPHYLIISSL